jgi:hypothetical protein
MMGAPSVADVVNLAVAFANPQKIPVNDGGSR